MTYLERITNGRQKTAISSPSVKSNIMPLICFKIIVGRGGQVGKGVN